MTAFVRLIASPSSACVIVPSGFGIACVRPSLLAFRACGQRATMGLDLGTARSGMATTGTLVQNSKTLQEALLPRVRTLTPSASPMHHWGAEVRRARTAAGMSQTELASLVPCDVSTVSRVEAGLSLPDEAFASACDTAFPGMGGWFTRFFADSQGWTEPFPPWFRNWVEEIERKAIMLRSWQPVLIPGLLQTEDYARAVLSSARRDSSGDVDAKVAGRIARQDILSRDDPADLRVVVYESVLQRQVGTPGTMRGQFAHLARMARRHNVTVQVIPESAGAYSGFAGAFTVATLADDRQIAHLETAARGMTVTDSDLVAQSAQMFDDLRDEALSRGASLVLIEEMERRWTQTGTAGGSPATPTRTAGTA